MSLTPYRDTLIVYKANTFSYSFTFEEDESPLDLTTLTNITVRFLNDNKTVFTHSVSGGELTISGASDNIISGSATDEVMDIGARSYDMEVIFDNSGAITTYVALDAQVIDRKNRNSTTTASFEVSITSSTGSIGGQPTVLYAETIEAKNAAEAAQLAAEQASSALLDGFFVERYNGSLQTIEFGPVLTVERYNGTVTTIEQS